MTSVVRAFSILGLALVVGLTHSWWVPISIAAEGNEQTAQAPSERTALGQHDARIDPMTCSADTAGQFDHQRRSRRVQSD